MGFMFYNKTFLTQQGGVIDFWIKQLVYFVLIIDLSITSFFPKENVQKSANFSSKNPKLFGNH